MGGTKLETPSKVLAILGGLAKGFKGMEAEESKKLAEKQAQEAALWRALMPTIYEERGRAARHVEEMAVRREEMEAVKEVGLKGVEARLWDILIGQQQAQMSAEARRYTADQALEGAKYRADKTYEASAYRADQALQGVQYSADASAAARTYASDKLAESSHEALQYRDKWEADRNAALKEIQQMRGDIDVQVANIRESRQLTPEQEYNLQRYGKLAQIPWSIMYMAYTTEDRKTRNNLMDLAAELSQYAFTEFMSDVEPVVGGRPMVPVFESTKVGGVFFERRGLEIKEPEKPEKPAPALPAFPKPREAALERPEGFDRYLGAAEGKPLESVDREYFRSLGWSEAQIEELDDAIRAQRKK